MWTFVGTLYFAVAVFINYIGLSSETTFKDLFPAFEDGLLAPIKKLNNETTEVLMNLRGNIKGRLIEFDAKTTFYERDDIIIGWKQKDVIKPLFNSAGRTDFVFDKVRNNAIRLDFASLHKLGVGRRERYVLADDQASLRRANYYKQNQGSQSVSTAVNDQGNYRAFNPEDFQAIFPAHCGSNNGIVHQVNTSAAQARPQVNTPAAQVRPQMNLQANTQAYQMYKDYFRGDKNN